MGHSSPQLLIPAAIDMHRLTGLSKLSKEPLEETKKQAQALITTQTHI